ncbi:hypothetical protein EH228_07550 [Erwinia endophytica]|uniref:HofO family protein n=1 Tax=Erwinia endophytica TaxID=1563158 RepID=UPI00126604ED|nr:hypothetical protein [Erwinia endophytica]KAB8312372.1 hypothetical protein EH228_07550 [Erwinia endophytica]
MNHQGWLIRWLHLSRWIRILCLVFSCGLLALALWQYGLRPLQRQNDLLVSQHQQLDGHYQKALRVLLRQPSLLSIEADIIRLQQALLADKRQAFSLSALIASTRGQLVAWQPGSDGGELSIRLRWPAVSAVLHYLSQLQPGIALPQFTLRAAENQLYFKLVLVLNHAA